MNKADNLKERFLQNKDNEVLIDILDEANCLDYLKN